jgi:hypothetical protein
MTTGASRARRRVRSSVPKEELQVECFIIADAAETANGKVSLLGGAWDELKSAAFPTLHPRLALAIVISVPWLETNQEHKLTINLVDGDGHPILPQPLTGNFAVGRPPTVTPGDPLKVPLSININNLRIEQEGRYTFTLELNGQERAKTSFRARKIA